MKSTCTCGRCHLPQGQSKHRGKLILWLSKLSSTRHLARLPCRAWVKSLSAPSQAASKSKGLVPASWTTQRWGNCTNTAFTLPITIYYYCTMTASNGLSNNSKHTPSRAALNHFTSQQKTAVMFMRHTSSWKVPCNKKGTLKLLTF